MPVISGTKIRPQSTVNRTSQGEEREKMSNVLAQMLDELMGRDRNLAPTEKRSETKWDDPDVITVISKQSLFVVAL